jgi:anthranilate synthase/aminodeoxychorismate synthase-like glutamine amidotransferase
MILVIDNHDSFVHNLARYIRIAGSPTRVVRSDAIDAAECERLAPAAILLSPGPKRPEDAGCCVDVIRRLGPKVPILGVCLGHQAIGHALGGRIIRVAPVHGRASDVAHDGKALFEGCGTPMRVGRYHSLAIDSAALPSDLIVTATARPRDGGPPLIMGIRHKAWPLYGVQFHPESVLTTDGDRLIANFVRLASARTHPTDFPSDHPQLVS